MLIETNHLWNKYFILSKLKPITRTVRRLLKGLYAKQKKTVTHP